MLQTKDAFQETADAETSSELYAERFGGEIGSWFLSVQKEATLRMLAPYPGATILDLGGGHGQTTEALVRRHFDVTVAGSSERSQARIQSLVDRNLCNFEVVDFLNLPFDDKSFGVVMCYRLLPHIRHWERFLAEMSRVAEKCILVDYPEKHSINYFPPQFLQFKRQLEGNTRPYTCFTGEELLREFRQHHFVNSDQYPEFFLPMFLHRKLKRLRLSTILERSSRQLGLTSRFGSPRILKLIREQQIRTN